MRVWLSLRGVTQLLSVSLCEVSATCCLLRPFDQAPRFASWRVPPCLWYLSVRARLIFFLDSFACALGSLCLHVVAFPLGEVTPTSTFSEASASALVALPVSVLDFITAWLYIVCTTGLFHGPSTADQASRRCAFVYNLFS